MRSKIVVTGISAITPLGNQLESIVTHLKAGHSGIRPIERYQVGSLPVKHAAMIDDSALDRVQYPVAGNIIFKLFYSCVKELLETGGPGRFYAPERISLIVGTDPNTSSPEDLQYLYAYGNAEQPPSEPMELETLLANHPSYMFYHAARDFGIGGPSIANFGTCAASAQAIGDAMLMLRSGDADAVITGGVSSKLDPMSLARLCRLGALEPTKDDCTENCSPFDLNRNGFTIGEGSVLFLLEREEDALRRHAPIYAEIRGYGSSLDGYSITDPHESSLGMILSMERAIEDAGVPLKAINYINAHGTGTPKNDKHETEAIKAVFGALAGQLDISSTKSMHGHLMTAAGAMETLVTILSLGNGFIPPTINHRTPDPQCDLNYTPNISKPADIEMALTNSFGMGGQNASLVIAKYKRG
ncbi:beta-ketoacyl-[acyl-carrier-protein] synthase family protein [Paenibacillus sp. FSL H7-0756]|jgi:3-oxoacyl-[acyl-carrier-protein] synthase II|uniref:beta-ketoacyl-[acyl-carrier-protein] synthase family protein n=1 Tax=unclassified Paenibacillus TaxID=185978 RepID=UPI0030F5A407